MQKRDIQGGARRRICAAALALALTACGGGGEPDSGPSVAVNSLPAVSTARADGTPQSANDAIDAYVASELRGQQIPGLSLAIMRNGQIVYAKSYGYADVATLAPARPEQRFDIGSMSKQFVAMAVLMLVERGRMGLDDKLAKHVGDSSVAGFENITVRQVLSHTAGLAEYPDTAFYDHVKRQGAYSEEQMLALFKNYPLRFPPGERFLYSNVGYDLLGFAVSRVTGRFYGDFIEQNILTPLGMHTARFIHADNGSDNMAQPYIVQGGAWQQVRLAAGVREYLGTGASGLQMSVLDLAKWDAALLAGTLISPAHQTLMWTSAATIPRGQMLGDAYGLGWILETLSGGHRLVSHAGGMPGYTSEFVRYLDSGWSVAVLTNLGETQGNPLVIARNVARMASGAAL